MTSPLSETPAPIDRDAVVDMIHALQVDLVILTDWLARDPEPSLPPLALSWLAGTSAVLQESTPARRQ